jgi:hypothetical protein
MSTTNQQQEEIASCQESILLLPVWQSLQAGEEAMPDVCLHLVRLSDGRLGLCNAETSQSCPSCACPVCEEHQGEQWISLPDEEGTWAEEQAAPLCETCILLPREAIYALHTLRLTINRMLTA